MATFKTSKDAILDLTLVEVNGELSPAEIINWIIEYYRAPPTKSILWDYTKADLAAGNMAAIEKILAQVLQTSGIRAGGKTALVFADKQGLELGEIFSNLVDENKLDVRFKAFLDTGDAISWLSE